VNELPEKLTAQQQKKREATIGIVKKAIDDVAAEGAALSVKRICEYSGLSRSVFSKPHIKRVLKEYGVGEKKAAGIERAESAKIEKLQAEINGKNDVIKRLKNELGHKTVECELLRGKLHMLAQKCRIRGVEIDDGMK